MAHNGRLQARTTRTVIERRALRETVYDRESGGGAHATASSVRRFDEPARAEGTDLRCGCHRLLARAVVAGIELRCPRCKTTQILAWGAVHALEASLVACAEVPVDTVLE